MNATATIVSKVWSFCTTLRGDGVSYGVYLEQMQICRELEAKLSEVQRLEQTLVNSVQQAGALRQSILKRAFAGALVPHPHDEPASELLSRIKAEKEAQSATFRKTGKGKA